MAWNKLLNDTIKVVLFNNVIVVPSLLYINAVTSGFEQEHSFTTEGLPTAF